MSKSIKLVAVLAISLSLSACTSQSFTSSSSKQFSPWTGDVQVLKKLPPEGTYVLIGVVKIEGSNYTSDDRLYDNMKAKAAKRGANAVVPQAKIKTQMITSGGTRRILAAYALRLAK
jgi:hypothetical protein